MHVSWPRQVAKAMCLTPKYNHCKIILIENSRLFYEEN